MIFLVVVAGLYLIGLIGYYKLTSRQVDQINQEEGYLPAKSVKSFMVLTIIAAFWPVLVYWALVGEASR